jgi:hypothetical protein
LGFVVVVGLATNSLATVLIDENFDSGYARTAQNIAGGNMAFYKGRSGTTPTVNVGSVSFSASSNNGSDGYWSYFTDPSASISSVGGASSVNNGHLLLGVGDQLTVSVSFNMGTVPAGTSIAALRFGIFDSVVSRATADASSGPSSNSFTNNPGFATFVPLTSDSGSNDLISLRRRTTLTSSNPMSSGGDWSQIDGLVGGAYSPLLGLTNYTFKMTIGRPDASTYQLSAAIIDTLSQAVMTSGSVSTNDGFNSFNWFLWRFPGMPTTANGGPYTFTDLNVQVTAIPEPSTVVLVGLAAGLLLAVSRRRR